MSPEWVLESPVITTSETVITASRQDKQNPRLPTSRLILNSLCEFLDPPSFRRYDLIMRWLNRTVDLQQD